MATVIHFNASGQQGDIKIMVQEDPNEVHSRFNAAAGVPFQLTQTGRREGLVIVNPVNVTYWHEAGEGGRVL